RFWVRTSATRRPVKPVAPKSTRSRSREAEGVGEVVIARHPTTAAGAREATSSVRRSPRRRRTALGRSTDVDTRIDIRNAFERGFWRARRSWARSGLWAGALVVSAALSGAASDARACGGEVYLEMDSNTQLVAKAEKLLVEGKYQQAVVKALQAYPALKII